MKSHHYNTKLIWKGNTGKGTETYRAYERAHEITVDGKPFIPGSSDPSFRGDPTRYNPEELFLASLSACHMLWFLHFCADASVVVLEYSDAATGTLLESEDGNGRFEEVMLHPKVVVKDVSMVEKTPVLHEKAHRFCFIANSCNFPVKHRPSCEVRS